MVCTGWDCPRWSVGRVEGFSRKQPLTVGEPELKTDAGSAKSLLRSCSRLKSHDASRSLARPDLDHPRPCMARPTLHSHSSDAQKVKRITDAKGAVCSRKEISLLT